MLAEPAGLGRARGGREAYLDAEVIGCSTSPPRARSDLLVVGRYAGSDEAEERRLGGLDAHSPACRSSRCPRGRARLPRAVDLSARALRRLRRRRPKLAHDRASRASWAADVGDGGGQALSARHPGPATSAVRRRRSDARRIADTPSHRADAGIAWGTLVHGLLEHAMRHKSATRDDLRRLAMWLTVEEPQLRAVIDQALDTVLAVATRRVLAAARASAECHEEVPFCVRETRDGVPTVVSGAIDLVHRAEDGWRIVDYKTDRNVDAAELQIRYAAQVSAYEKSWRRFVAGSIVAQVTRIGR